MIADKHGLAILILFVAVHVHVHVPPGAFRLRFGAERGQPIRSAAASAAARPCHGMRPASIRRPGKD
jgi:hypothetical protein